ncbi:hypothetical protein AMTR_s00071p00140450 [Amborella trichopoda]|uniref:Uncharacterized protein n=1 Tax=Amborella trichopoda TaxID=13333 RepID=U5DHK1_AMBTC|nr:hypothetical protein AMTR_s00071p00140450 [Amborella trichopoda]
MNFKNVRVPKVPGGGAASALSTAAVLGGLGIYAAFNSLYTVEGGHRAIVFNRVVGIKDKGSQQAGPALALAGSPSL